MRRAGLLVLVGSLTACANASSGALHRTVVSYDRTVANTVSELLLLNVARAHRNMPPHFTAVSSIAATYDFRFNAGIGPAATGELGWLPLPSIGTSVGENPTMTLTPMQGDEFTNRILTPFPDDKVALLLGQGYDVDALLRLLGESIELSPSGAAPTLHNRPTDRSSYIGFRRALAHLSSIQDRHALHADAVRVHLHRVIPAASYTGADVREHASDPSFTYDAARQVYEFDTQVLGRVVVSNYDLATLPHDERARLYEETRAMRFNEVLVDVRAGHPGGEYPLRGVLRLRSFMNVLAFVGLGIAAEREFDVPADPRTPPLRENPASALGIFEGPRAPDGADFQVTLGDRVYALAPDRGYPWNRRAFSILYQLFQMTVAPAHAPTPLISISR